MYGALFHENKKIAQERIERPALFWFFHFLEWALM